jgi:hypothetical protein
VLSQKPSRLVKKEDAERDLERPGRSGQEGRGHGARAGRLGTYQCYNMDQVVAQALKTWERIRSSRTLVVR